MPISLIRVIRVLICLTLAAAIPVQGLNQRLYPLAELIKDADCIAVGRAVAVDVPNMRAALVVEGHLKGQVPYQWMALNVAPGGWGHPPAMIRRLGPGLPLVFFTAKVKGRHVVLGYTNGTWFQMTAPDGPDSDRLPWSFTHCEIFLRRTFQGPTAELEAILKDVLAGKREAPPVNPGGGQGMGPEVPRDYRPDRPLPTLPEHVAKAMAQPKQGGPVRNLAVRPLTAAEQQWVDLAAKKFEHLPGETAMLLAQADYRMEDAQRALEYERDHGRGGNRAWVRAAEEILELKQRSDRLSWLDVRGVLQRAGELFTPVTDPVEMIHALRLKFTWDELDPLLDDEKWGRKRLSEETGKRLAARMPHPLTAGERAGAPLSEATFGLTGTGDATMESVGWKPLPGSWDFARRQYDWDGGPSGSQRPGGVKFTAPGSSKNPLSNLPPRPGIPLAGKAGRYGGTSLWFATGRGDDAGRSRGDEGAQACWNRSWATVNGGEARSFLVTAQVYTPDHTDEVGEPRGGWFYIRRPSRYIDAGIRIVDAGTRSTSRIPDEALMLKVEPALGRFDRVLLRVDFTSGETDGQEVRLTAFLDGVGEVARATAKLHRNGDMAFTPAFGSRRPGDGYVPEFYLAGASVRSIEGKGGR